MARELIFIRHGETVWNQEKRLQGHGDSPLTEQGRAQVRAHLYWLSGRAPARLFSSPLGRAQTSAAILADSLGLQVECCDGLKERCMGAYEGWTLAELERRDPAAAAARREDLWSFRAPGGENYPDMLARVAPVIDRISRQAEAGIVIVSHGSLVRPMLGHLLQLQPADILRVMQPNDLAYRIVLGSPATVYRHRGNDVRPGLLMDGLG